MKNRNKNKFIVVSAFLFLLAGCSAGGGGNGPASSGFQEPDSAEVTPTPSPEPESEKAVSTEYVAFWEKKNSSHRVWSEDVRKVIEAKASSLYAGPEDVEDFCPAYSHLGKLDRLNFWVEFFAGVSYYESGHNPTSRYTEASMGTDPVTGRQVVSEGLLQLSYQDTQWAPYCDFDYEADRKYSSSDPRRSILDPAKNLSCGIQILNNQVKRQDRIALSSGVYWSVLKVNGKYSKLKEIKSLTRALDFCKN